MKKIRKSTLENFNIQEGRKEFIDAYGSGMYAGRNVEDEEVMVLNGKGVGMEIWTRHKEKPNWWEVVSYDKEGCQESVTYEWCKEEE